MNRSIRFQLTLGQNLKKNKGSSKNCPQLKGPADVAKLFSEVLKLERCILLVVTIDSEFRLLAWNIVSIGNSESITANGGDFFGDALAHGGQGIILVHNNPFGGSSIELQEFELNDQVTQMAENLGYCLVDHLILYNRGFRSLNNYAANSRYLPFDLKNRVV